MTKLVTLVVGVFWVIGYTYAAEVGVHQDWPQRPIRAVVPAAPGGAMDITARLFRSALSDFLGQQVVIDNRPGASGNIGLALVAQARPDGYTLLVGNISTNAINPTIFASTLKFDIARELTAVTMLSRIPNLMVSATAFPPSNLRELIEYAKSHPGKLNYSNVLRGAGHLDTLEFARKAGIEVVNVPSKGSGSVVASIIAGEIHFAFSSAATVTPHVKAGRMKAFVTTAQRRQSDLPSIPTMAEAGFPGIGSEFWIGFFVPTGTPLPIMARLHAAVVHVAQQPQMKELVAKANVPLEISASAEDFQRYVEAETKRFADIIRRYDLHAQ